ncbi:MAG: hypothetical protein M3387_09855 [Actinomycetota bacterium]|nr:hypothetical protein [Actinomycetota bacterium]
MTGRGELAVLAAIVACCAGKALLLTGVFAVGGALPAGLWLVAAAVAVAAVAIWQTTVALRRRGEGS